MVSLLNFFLSFYSLKLIILTKISLLEKVSIYINFDALNSKHSILSLETTGDSYQNNIASPLGECKLLIKFW